MLRFKNSSSNFESRVDFNRLLQPDKDMFFFDEKISPFHRVVSYPLGDFRPSNLHPKYLDPEITSDCPKVLSAAPFAPDLPSLSFLEVLNIHKSKQGFTNIHLTTGEVAKNIHLSMESVRSNLAQIYSMAENKEQLAALREITNSKLLPFRFRWLLKQKKLDVASQSKSDFLGLFKSPNFYQ